MKDLLVKLTWEIRGHFNEFLRILMAVFSKFTSKKLFIGLVSNKLIKNYSDFKSKSFIELVLVQC
jgi:hypothetical protein